MWASPKIEDICQGKFEVGLAFGFDFGFGSGSGFGFGSGSGFGSGLDMYCINNDEHDELTIDD